MVDPELPRILELYVDRFNRRDWDGVRELISADARLTVADAFTGKLADAPYFRNYERRPTPWKLAVGELDSELVVIIMQRGVDTWTPYSVVYLDLAGHQIDHIRDYSHCPWLISAAGSVAVSVSPV